MTSRVPFQTQLSSIMEVLVKAAVAEIAKLVDDKCAFLHLEISQKQSENEMLKRKLLTMETEHSQLQLRFETHLNRGTDGTNAEGSCTSPTGNIKFPDDEDGTLPFTIKEESPDEALWLREPAAPVDPPLQYHDTTDNQQFENHPLTHSGLTRQKSPDFSNLYNSAQRTVEVNGLQFTVKTEKDDDQLSVVEEKCHHNVGKQNQHAADFSFNERENQLWSTIIEVNDIEAGFPDFNSVVEEYSNTFSSHPDANRESNAGYKQSNVPHLPSSRPCNVYSSEYDKEVAQSSSFQPKPQVGLSHQDKLKEQMYLQRNSLHLAQMRQSGDCCERQSSAADVATATHPQTNLHHQNSLKHQPGMARGPFICSHCGKTFSRVHQLKLHQKCHKRKRTFWCTVCGKSFQCSSHLSIHHRTHTGEKPFGCGQCGKRFTQQSSLRVHQRTHSGERPYSCAQCGKTFILMHHLKRHHIIHS
ncbi:zinc finger protein 27-like [Gouania willdenowi]|uniref:zinc finger protein 27-like n=1 Tax=Gouania willdenowi TaxID=441366 RepID=UPI001055238D|nr:zinc finger protein 27-like [Gouania willdenowi]